RLVPLSGDLSGGGTVAAWSCRPSAEAISLPLRRLRPWPTIWRSSRPSSPPRTASSSPVEDVSDLWLNVKDSFEQRLPVKKACLNNKARNPVLVENLPAEFIQTTDSRLRSRFPQEQYLFWFREPYATVVLVTCE
uniref:Uncharacterized protein n=1 Tax=Aegilops tauschii subsp. strangulata TaxID=200361 RepID=A0A453JZR9_AEGTS